MRTPIKNPLPALLLTWVIVVLHGCSGVAKEKQAVEPDPTADSPAVDAEVDKAASFPADDPGSVSFTNIEDALTVRVIYFDYDSSNVQPAQRGVVEAHGRFLAANPDTRVVLEGHADERGSREYNLALGERRSVSVKSQLVLLGAAEDQIRVVSYGEERPAVEGQGEDAWQQNRRVEIFY